MNKKTHFKGREHPNFKHGRYVGQKAKQKQPTPKTGATAALQKWVTKQTGAFISDAALAALPQFSKRCLQNGLTCLKRKGLVRETGGWLGSSKVWEIVK